MHISPCYWTINDYVISVCSCVAFINHNFIIIVIVIRKQFTLFGKSGFSN